MFHFLIPFFINILSAIIIIVVTARQRMNAHRDQTREDALRRQLLQHRHLVITPLILIILALPRLVITFVSGCMKSTNETWLYLIGYFVSFIPPILTFVSFVLPSKGYKREFLKPVRQYRRGLTSR